MHPYDSAVNLRVSFLNLCTITFFLINFTAGIKLGKAINSLFLLETDFTFIVGNRVKRSTEIDSHNFRLYQWRDI